MTRDISMHLPGLTASAGPASTVKAAHLWVPLVAAIIVLLLVLVAVFAVQLGAKSAKNKGTPSGRGGLFHGYDRRWSTSKTIAALWTIVVAFMVVTEALLAVTGNAAYSGKTVSFGVFMKHTLDDPANRGLYLILLGGPYAAALFAKTVVTNRVNNGTLQKTDGTPNQLSDVVSNDAGAVDLYDLQYTLFNFAAQVITVAAFCANEAAGLPALPNFIAFLTGGSALTYSVNKGVTTNQPVLTAVHPQSARIGDRVTAYGNNLTAVSAASKLKAAVAGVDAAIVDPPPPAAAADASTATAGGQDQVDFLVPAPPASVAWSARDQLQVSVTTPAGLVAVMNNALTVVPDQPVAVGLSPALLAVASAKEYADIKVMMQGQFLATPGATTADKATAQISIHGPNTAAMTTAAYEDDNRVSFVLPADAPAPAPGETLVFQVQLIRGASSTKPLALSVQAAPPPVLNSISPAMIIADPGTGLAGQGIMLAGANLVALQPVAGSPPHVAQAGAEPLQAVVTEAVAGTVVGQLADQPRAGNTAAVSLLAPLAAQAAGDTEVGIMLRRGTLSSASLTLTVRARHDPAMEVTPIVAPAGTPLAGHDVTLHSSVLSVHIPPAPSVRHIADATPLVAHIDADGVALEKDNLPLVKDTDTGLTFQLPDGTPVMPEAPGDGTTWAIQVTRSGHAIATGQLNLRNQ